MARAFLKKGKQMPPGTVEFSIGLHPFGAWAPNVSVDTRAGLCYD